MDLTSRKNFFYYLLNIGEQEKDTSFEATLNKTARTGMQVYGILGALMIISFVLMHIFFRGLQPVWSYSDYNVDLHLPLPDKVFILAISLFMLALSKTRLALKWNRLILGVAFWSVCMAITFDDILSGDVSFSTAYLSAILIIAASSIPYKGWQMGVLSLLIIFGVFSSVSFFPSLLQSEPLLLNLSQKIFLILIGIFLTGFSSQVYSSRFSQYKSHKEIEDLSNSLLIEKEKTTKMLQKIESLFGQQVSSEIASEMINSETELSNKIYETSVMFLDIRDFTLLADSSEPAEVATFQNTVFSAIIEIVEQHNGIVLQLLGDGAMIVFGAPVTDIDHQKRAVNAGFDILKKIKRLSEQKLIPEIRIGIGINSGTVLAGNVGNNSRKSYSLTGKNVIIAARIEQLNKRFESQFLVSENVYQRVKTSKLESEYLGEIQLKGIKTPVGIHKLY